MVAEAAALLRGPLGRFVRARGGLTPLAAIHAAENELDVLREVAGDSIAAELDSLTGYLGLIGDQQPPPPVPVELHRIATSIATLAGLAGRERLAAAALLLCETLDAQIERGRFCRESIEVHRDGLRKLHLGECADAAAEELLVAGLASVRDHAIRKAG